MKINKKLLLLLCFSLTGNIFYNNPICSYALEQNDDEEFVNVPDYNLKRGFLEAINHFNGVHTPVTDSQIREAKFKKKDLKKITALSPEVCTAHCAAEEGVKIVDLTGIEACVNLEDLSLVNQRITSLEPLKNLTKLKRLELRNSSNKGEGGKVLYISDVSPLKNLINLEILNLQQAKITNIGELSNLIRLKHLTLMGTKISSLDFARNMTNLEYLDLDFNNISDISPLENCTNLKVLKFSNDANLLSVKQTVNDISSLSKLVNLEELRFSNQNISDISVVKNFKNLKNLELQNNLVENFEDLFYLDNLKELWILGNNRKLSNDISKFNLAKSYFNKINKKTLKTEDSKYIDEILNSNNDIKNYFSENTLNELKNIKKDLETKENVNNYLYDENKEQIAGEIVKLEKLKEITILKGEEILSKLPKAVKIGVKVLKEIEKTPENPKDKETPDTDIKPNPNTEISNNDENLGIKNNKLYLKFIDNNGTSITDEISVTAKSDYSNINGVLENGLFYFENSGEDYDYTLTLNSKNYELIDRVKFTTKYDTSTFKGVFSKYEKNEQREIISNENLENLDKNLFIIKVQKKVEKENSSTILNNPSSFRARSLSVRNSEIENTEKNYKIKLTHVKVNWNIDEFKNEAGVYKINGELVLPEGITNPKKAKISVNVKVIDKKAEKEEILGKIVNENNKEFLKIAILNDDSKLILEPVVFYLNNKSYISKDGYLLLPLENGTNNLKLDSEKYTLEKEYLFDVVYGKLSKIGGRKIYELSELGLGRKLIVKLIKNENKNTIENIIKTENNSDKTNLNKPNNLTITEKDSLNKNQNLNIKNSVSESNKYLQKNKTTLSKTGLKNNILNLYSLAIVSIILGIAFKFKNYKNQN